MKKLFLRLLFIPSLSFAELKSVIPLWNQTNELICSGQYLLKCSEESCSKGESTAIWKINFTNSKITMLTDGSEYNIDAKFFKDYESSTNESSTKHVIFFSGRMMDFNMDYSFSYDPDIHATVTDIYWLPSHKNKFSKSTMKYLCHPQN